MNWIPVAFCEFDAFPSAVLAHRWPHVPNLGDMTKWREWSDDMFAQVDVLVGGTPCQAFSVAGLRNSLDDERGNLTLIYAHILDHIDTVRRERGLPPCVCLWENVPGVLSTKDNAFGCFLGALAGEDEALVPSGKKWTNAGYVRGPERSIAWTIKDAQFFGVAQRRRRVFVVASARDGFRPEEVLFIEQGVFRDSPPSREKGQEIAPTIRAGAANGGAGHGARSGDSKDELITPRWWDGGQVSQTLDAVLSKGQTMPEKNRFPEVLVPDAYGIPGNWIGREPKNGGNATQFPHEISPCLTKTDKHGVVAFTTEQTPEASDELAFTLTKQSPTGGGQHQCVAFAQNTRDEVREMAVVGALAAQPGMKQTSYIRQAMAVRRLTPVETARLQGFPDFHARIPWRGKPAEECPDGPQYRCYGNSMAVPVISWLGKQIAKHLHP